MMQSWGATEITPKEWRWVFTVGGVLTALTLLPYAWALAANARAADWQFMGILANPLDGATYLAKIGLGIQGEWIFHLTHTPEAHAGAAVYLFYILLGHVAHLIGVSNLVVFHLARVVATLFMFSTLYQLGATIWTRERPRRLFFGLASLASGLGWIALLFNVEASALPDLTVPEAYPLYAAYANPHFPLAIGCLALLAASYVKVFRIDFREEPAVANGGLTIFVLALVLALVMPHALVPLGSTLVLYLVITAARRRTIPVLELRWTAMLFLPAALVAVYLVLVLTYNPAVQIWNAQIHNLTAHPLLILLGYGLLPIVALPGLARAVRRFEEDGDQLMLLWLVVNLVAVFIPFNHQRRFMIGLVIPLVFFAVRSLEDYWLVRYSGRGRTVIPIALVLAVIPTHVITLGVPLFGIVNPQAGLGQRLLLERDYWDVMVWLRHNGSAEDVVLSSPNVGLWIPAYADKRVVYGHPFETLRSAARYTQVEDWFSGHACYWPTQERDGYSVRYIVVGPQERALDNQEDGREPCYSSLGTMGSRILDFGAVTLYELPR
ncbi:MAG: hypothetical protein HPY64_12450 [Anaerolineae bacterium]|nr:hypothetical protein [Anaerolineae bacterium]